MNELPVDESPPDRPRRGLAGRMVDVVVAPFVQPVVDAVDVREVVHRIDVDEVLSRIDVDEVLSRIDLDALTRRINVDELLGRVDLDALIGRIDVDEVLSRIDVDSLTGRIDVDQVLGRVDLDGLTGRINLDEVLGRIDLDGLTGRINVDELLGRIDLDALIGRINVDEVLGRVDLDALIGRINVDELLGRVDLDALMGRIDVNGLVDRVDPNRLLDRVDANGLLDRIDPDQLLDRVDPNRLLQRVDFDAVVAQVDVNAVMERVDVNSLVSRTELGEVIARSTTGVFGQLLDAARIAIMSLDLTLHGLTARVLRRDDPTMQGGPGGIDDRTHVWRLPPQDRAVALQGRYAGAVSRFLAFLLDATLAGALFGLVATLLVSALEIVANVTWDATDHRLLIGLAYTFWQFLYFAGLTAVAGRTVGKAVLGVCVVQHDGSRVGAAGASLRTVAFPLSFLLFGAGFFLGVVRRDRRQLHDLIGRTAVVYTWDAETARLRSGTRAPVPP